MSPLVNSFFEPKGRGEFSMLNLSLAMVNNAVEYDPESWLAEPEATRIDRWMDTTAYFHELRHYHDLVGTVCGFHVLLEATALVDHFYAALRQEAPIKLSMPLKKTQPQLKAVQLYLRYREFLKVVLGDVGMEYGWKESKHVPVRHFVSDVPNVTTTYPLVPVTRPDPWSGSNQTRLIPLGLRSLMEHIATEMQIFIVVIAAGQDPHDKIDAEGRVRRMFDIWGSLFRSDFIPYVTAYLFASYRLHVLTSPAKPDRSKFTPGMGEILAIAEASLDFSGYHAFPDPRGSYSWEFEHPGLAFAHLVDSWGKVDRATDLKIMVDEAARNIKVLGKTYREFLKSYVDALPERPNGLVPPHLRPISASDPLIAQLRKDLFQDHEALITMKAENLDSWFMPPLYIDSINRLPSPPLQSVPGLVVTARNKDRTLRFLWWNFMVAFMEGLVESTEILCPIMAKAPFLGRHIAFPDPEDSSRTTNCTGFIEARKCGLFNGQFLSTQPPCPFVDVIAYLLKEYGIQSDSKEKLSHD